jgi:hypothetical protein
MIIIIGGTVLPVVPLKGERRQRERLKTIVAVVFRGVGLKTINVVPHSQCVSRHSFRGYKQGVGPLTYSEYLQTYSKLDDRSNRTIQTIWMPIGATYSYRLIYFGKKIN